MALYPLIVKENVHSVPPNIPDIKTVSVLSRHTECASEIVYSLEAILVKNKSTT